MNLDILPPEIITKIVCNLRIYKDRLHLGAVNRSLKKYAYKWPDVSLLIVESETAADLHVLKLFDRLSKLKALCFSGRRLRRVVFERFEEMIDTLGRSVKKLSIINTTLRRDYINGFIGMPNLRFLAVDFVYLKGKDLSSTMIEDLYLNVLKVGRAFRRFSQGNMPANLQTLTVTLRSPVRDIGHLSSFPASLRKLDIQFNDSICSDHLMQIDFGYLSNLEELTINNCAQFDDAFIYDYKDFVNIMGNFVKDRLPASLTTLRVARLFCGRHERELARLFATLLFWTTFNSRPPPEHVGLFPVSRQAFVNASAGIAVDRPKPLLIVVEDGSEYLDNGEEDPFFDLEVHPNLRFRMVHHYPERLAFQVDID